MFRLLSWTVLAPIALTINAGAAQAGDEIGLSLDGSSWTSELKRPLFEPRMRWVPGDTETRSFWVRNQGPTAASVRIAVRADDPDGLLARDDIVIEARMHGGTWLPLPDAGASSALTDDVMAQGDRLQVDVRVAFDPASTNQSERNLLPLIFVVRLTQAGPGGDDGLSGNLPETGTGVEPWILWLGSALIGGGLVLLVAARQREASDD